MKDAIAVLAPRSEHCVCLALNLSTFGARASGIEAIFQDLESILAIPFVRFRQDNGPPGAFIDVLDQVDKVAGGVGRLCLLVAGQELDGHVSTAVLAALATGYDVYLLNDILLCGHSKFEQAFLQRLIQAGAVPTTMGQCLFQWGLTLEDDAKRQAVASLALRWERMAD